MKSLGFITACWALAVVGCAEYVSVDQGNIDDEHAVLLVMTRDRSIHRLTHYEFTTSFLAGSGERLQGSFQQTVPFFGRIPYQEIAYVGRERLSIPQITYALAWAFMFAGFYTLLYSGERNQRSQENSPRRRNHEAFD